MIRRGVFAALLALVALALPASAGLIGIAGQKYFTSVAVTQSQDWINRSTAAGVTAAYCFETGAEVTDNVHGDGNGGAITRDTSDGIGDCKSLKIPVAKATGANAGSWRVSLNDAWTTHTQGFGSTKFYLQFRVKLGPARLLNESTRGAGFKMVNLAGYYPESPNSSDSFTNFELVLANFYYRGYVEGYRAGGPDGNSDSFTVDDSASGADPALVQAFQQWNFMEEEWFTVYMAIKIAVYGGGGNAGCDASSTDGAPSAGNEFDLYMAGPADTSYTHVYSARDFGIGCDPEYPGGINGIHLNAYDTGRSSSLYESWHKYTQPIVSTNPIAVPMPTRALPSWASGATLDAWLNVPGTSSGNIAASGAADTTDMLAAWTGMAYDTELRRIYGVAMGGHADRTDNDAVVLDLNGETAAWDQVMASSGATRDSDPPSGHSGALSDGSRYPDHNYNTPTWANGRVYLPAMCAISGINGNSSPVAWYWDPADAGSSDLGYTSLGKWDTSLTFPDDGVRLVQSGAAYDPIGRKVWYSKQNWSGTPSLVSIDVDTNSMNTYTGMTGNGNTIHTLIAHPGKRLLLLIGANGTLRMNLDSPGTFATVNDSSGRPTLPYTNAYGAVLCASCNAWQGAVLFWPNGGNMLSVMDIPENAHGSSAYAWSTYTPGGTGPSAPDQTGVNNGTWKKMGAIPMGDGYEYVFITTRDNEATKFFKKTRPGE